MSSKKKRSSTKAAGNLAWAENYLSTYALLRARKEKDERHFEDRLKVAKGVLGDEADLACFIVPRTLLHGMRALYRAYAGAQKSAQKHAKRVERFGGWAGSGYLAMIIDQQLRDCRQSFDMLDDGFHRGLPHAKKEAKRNAKLHPYPVEPRVDPLLVVVGTLST
jgi:hypothetical protein